MSVYKDLFVKFLEEREVTSQTLDEHVVRVAFAGENLNTIPLYVVFDKNGNGVVQFHCSDILTFKENDAAAIVTCNKLNAQYRWVKFYLNDQNEIAAECDAFIDEATCGEECFRLVLHIIDIIDEAYLELMRAKLEVL